MIFNSFSVRIKFFKISVLTRSNSRTGFFVSLDLKAPSMARERISMVSFSTV